MTGVLEEVESPTTKAEQTVTTQNVFLTIVGAIMPRQIKKQLNDIQNTPEYKVTEWSSGTYFTEPYGWLVRDTAEYVIQVFRCGVLVPKCERSG